MCDYVVTGLFFHTNSEETFYTFKKDNKTNLIEMEMAVSPGLYDSYASYQDSYYHYRQTLICICDTFDKFIQNPILHLLYKLSLVVSEPSDRLKTKIIWKCLRLTDKYEEFYPEGNKLFLISSWYKNIEAHEIINQNRLERVFRLVCNSLKVEYDTIIENIAKCKKDIEYQKHITSIVHGLRKTTLDDNCIEVIGKFL